MGSFNPAWALHHDEIRNRGIHFDHHRMCTPYIREHMLFPLFFDLTDHVRSTYLLEYQHGCFYLRPEFDTQAKVEAHFELGPEASTEEKNRVERLKNGLYYLISEVLFFEAPFSNGQAFHPRHSMQKTWSFQELDPYTRQQLSELYNEYFYKRNNDFWREQALIKLPAIKNATDMLICGEDLGMVPDSVPSVMRELGILSLEVQRMPKDTKIEFGHPANYPYLSVATPSSHDTSTIRGWWEEDSTRAQRFYSQILGQWGSSPFFCEPEIVRQVINQHLYSPSMWAVFPIQDLLGLDANLRLPDARAERINEPANSTHYWRYRLHISLEDLIAQTEFNQTLLQLQKQSGRYNSY
jgi:4-alpha-glucanotransferase